MVAMLADKTTGPHDIFFHRAVHKAMITQQMCWRQNK
jgi:hypothetical protein